MTSFFEIGDYIFVVVVDVFSKDGKKIFGGV